jgi:hypothetical protein
MPKFMIPHEYEPDGPALVSLAAQTPTTGEVTFAVGNDWHIFHLSRAQLEQLRRDIDAKLKAAPLPARGKSGAPSASGQNK